MLTDKTQVKRIEFLEMTKDTADGGDVDAAEQFDIDFAVMAGELAKLLEDLGEAMGGEVRKGAEAARRLARAWSRSTTRRPLAQRARRGRRQATTRRRRSATQAARSLTQGGRRHKGCAAARTRSAARHPSLGPRRRSWPSPGASNPPQATRTYQLGKEARIATNRWCVFVSPEREAVRGRRHICRRLHVGRP